MLQSLGITDLKDFHNPSANLPWTYFPTALPLAVYIHMVILLTAPTPQNELKINVTADDGPATPSRDAAAGRRLRAISKLAEPIDRHCHPRQCWAPRLASEHPRRHTQLTATVNANAAIPKAAATHETRSLCAPGLGR